MKSLSVWFISSNKSVRLILQIKNAGDQTGWRYKWYIFTVTVTYINLHHHRPNNKFIQCGEKQASQAISWGFVPSLAEDLFCHVLSTPASLQRSEVFTHCRKMLKTEQRVTQLLRSRCADGQTAWVPPCCKVLGEESSQWFREIAISSPQLARSGRVSSQ